MVAKLITLLVVLPIVCEAITEIVGGSELFKPLREPIIKNNIPFFSKLFSCKYCLSVWVSAFVCFMTLISFGTDNIDFTVFVLFAGMTLLVHRLSNIYHLVTDIVTDYRRERWIYNIPNKEGG